jgi:hypothetical protein
MDWVNGEPGRRLEKGKGHHQLPMKGWWKSFVTVNGIKNMVCYDLRDVRATQR